MLSQHFQQAHAEIVTVGENLLQFLKEFRQQRLTEGDDTQSLENVESDIVKAIKALKAQKYEVAVVAPMKAGKSTFLNAIIGADVLASESAACTICRTDVQHISQGSTPSLLEYKQDRTHPSVVSEGNATEIQEKFLERTRQIRDRKRPDERIPERFKLKHPIEAIGDLPSLSGFTLIDTPGPNEWESASSEVSTLKQASLEALRTCKAVLFVLNYRSYKDNAVDELFASITKNRQELLQESKGRIYFILNQVDLKSEKDPEISETIRQLKQDLDRFGFPDPVVFPVSALQGLLAKLIQQDRATEKQVKDFKKFFSAQYSEENEDGDMIIPAPKKIASQAVRDSGILDVQEAVFQTIVQTAGWNLLSDVLSQLDRSAKSTETTLNVQIAGWQLKVDELREKVDEYKKRRASARDKIDVVRAAVSAQKDRLMEGFGAGVDTFAEAAKEKIQEQIDLIAETRSSGGAKQLPNSDTNLFGGDENFWGRLFREGVGIAGELLELIPQAGRQLSKAFRVSVSLFERMNGDGLIPGSPRENSDPYIIEYSNKADAQRIALTINDYCAPYIQSWWVDVQDRLIRQGEKTRENLVIKIQNDIQGISDELSEYLGESLQAKININPIQFPEFEFQGLDEMIFKQQEIIQKATKREKRTKCCSSNEVYYVDVPFEEKDTVFAVDLRETAEKIKVKINEQVERNKGLLARVVQKQVDADFANAEKQISEYMSKFQIELERILSERDKKQEEAPLMIELLKGYSQRLERHLQTLNQTRVTLDEWKPR
ncbi:dynamin family protein [Oscillatoria sp. FACHB-1406]|uniref:dynamin family protein n=1 Tax=Oscillatoria sp. FACHB-1406 TaxID=2692846 RepID=UPI001688683B|nr:dynamin family protein [Oscillatoria sp. FACHB-1406]MBD2579906.1 dynamin family protein [Oscillatoria sp. FACHB-1406]